VHEKLDGSESPAALKAMTRWQALNGAAFHKSYLAKKCGTFAGVLASVVGAYYYLAIIKIMYFDEPAKGFGPMPVELKAVLAVSGLFNLLFFVYPGPLVEAATAAAKSLF